MSGALRRLSQSSANKFLTNSLSAASAVQLRRVGDLPVKPNKHIEAWATYREHVEDTFTFDPKTLAILSVTLVAFPTFLYNVMASEYNKADDKAGRPHKIVM